MQNSALAPKKELIFYELIISSLSLVGNFFQNQILSKHYH